MLSSAVYAADKAGKKIERIELTVDEANELARWFRRSLYLPPSSDFKFHYTVDDAGKPVGTFYGADIYVEPKT